MSRAVMSQRSPAFTIVELLVVLAMIAVLIALRLPAMARAERGTKITQCAGNLKQFNLGVQLYAGENNDKLPSNTSTLGIPVGNWPWDMAWNIGEQLERYGVDWRMMFCPGTAPRFTESIDYTLYDYYSPGNLHVIGYGVTFQGVGGLMSTNINSTLTSPLFQFGPLLVRQLPSDRVLLADATISGPGQNNETLRYSYNYTSVVGAFPTAHVSPHLSANFPLGGNLSMLDGHVEWRRFQDMHPRTSNVVPGFWW